MSVLGGLVHTDTDTEW